MAQLPMLAGGAPASIRRSADPPAQDDGPA
jgi:hypothetical protein